MCPVCQSPSGVSILCIDDVPVMSCQLFSSADEARAIDRGTIDLWQCVACGHLHNAAFESAQVVYSPTYESTQAFSETFDRFHRELAASLDVAGKTIVEIGCGDGEFLQLIREQGATRAIGFDPASNSDDPEITRELFPQPIPENTDLVVCKMTLEHIPDVHEFLSQIDRPIFITVPNSEPLFPEDIYYEHCQYFTSATLATAAERAGFEVTRLEPIYGDQYLAMYARPTSQTKQPRSSQPTEVLPSDQWSDALRHLSEPVYLWGSGSKAVAFLSLVDPAHIVAAVDINPRKHGHFLPGTGLPIIAPTDLPDRASVVAMNPIYRDEIASQLGPGHHLLTIREL